MFDDDVERQLVMSDRCDYISRQIAVAKVAAVMEQRAGYEPDGLAFDDQLVDRYEQSLHNTPGLSSAEGDMLVEYINQKATTLLTALVNDPAFNAAVEAVADQLYEHETVFGSEIRRIVEAAKQSAQAEEVEFGKAQIAS